MFKGMEAAIFLFLGTAVGIMSTNLSHFSNMSLAFAQAPLFIVAGGALILVGKLFPKVSAKVIANVWGGAYAAYIAVPATKILTGSNVPKEQVYMFAAALVSGFIVSWFLFRRADKTKSSTLVRA